MKEQFELYKAGFEKEGYSIQVTQEDDPEAEGGKRRAVRIAETLQKKKQREDETVQNFLQQQMETI